MLDENLSQNGNRMVRRNCFGTKITELISWHNSTFKEQLTLRSLAERIQCPKSTLQDYFSGNTEPKFTVIEDICSFFGIETTFFGRDYTEEPSQHVRRLELSKLSIEIGDGLSSREIQLMKLVIRGWKNSVRAIKERKMGEPTLSFNEDWILQVLLIGSEESRYLRKTSR